jgi:DNA-binding XRE family transcriptional regulator
MPNIGSLLKEEIARLARRELRNETAQLKKASARHRAEIAALKRRIAALEKQLARALRRPASPPGDAPEPQGRSGPRYSAKGLPRLREKLGVSAAQLGRLLSVSAQTIYNWEAGKTRPRPAQIAALAALRGIGKREAAARLAGNAQSD